jgi:hypothetical protein
MMRLFRRNRKVVARQRVLNHPFAALGEPAGADYRGVPTTVCPCGSDMLLICCIFDPQELLPGMFMLDAMCACCGALLTVADPTLLEDY